jgi:hypothetical protein
MEKEIRLNTITWIALVLLIVVSTLFSENGFENSFIVIIGFAALKFLSIMFQFVETKHAHIVWKIVSLVFVLIYLVGIIALY